MIKKFFVGVVLIVCAFFVGVAIVDAEESYKTFTVQELVNIINNGEYTTKEIKSDSEKKYLVAEASENNLVLRLSSNLDKSITLTYDSATNSLNYEEETSDSDIAEIQMNLINFFVWVLEASGSNLEESTKLVSEIMFGEDDTVSYEECGFDFEVSASASNDAMSSKALIKFELSDKFYTYGKKLLNDASSDSNVSDDSPEGDGTNPNTGINDYYWILLVAFIGMLLVLLSQKNRKIFKI